jgi:hypothetical protein
MGLLDRADTDVAAIAVLVLVSVLLTVGAMLLRRPPAADGLQLHDP